MSPQPKDPSPRRRYVRPGFDARDLTLSNETMCWDSDWEEVLNVYRASWAAQSALTFKKIPISYQGQSVNIYLGDGVDVRGDAGLHPHRYWLDPSR